MLEICEIIGKMSSEKNFCFEFCNHGNNFNEKVHNYDKFLFEHTENRSSISKRTYYVDFLCSGQLWIFVILPLKIEKL